MLDSWTHQQPDMRSGIHLGISERGVTWSNFSGTGMSTLTPVEEDSLLSPEEVQAQREWDLEFQRRKDDLARQQLKSRERRRAVSDKMAELRDRWQGVERRRQLRSREGGRSEQPAMTLSVPSTQSGGSHAGSNAEERPDNSSRETSNESSGLNR